MSITQNNVYVHSSPPKAISGSGMMIRQWVKNGDIDKLEGILLEGQGARLLGLVESTPDNKVKAFLRSIPGYMAKVDMIHDAVIRGSLRETQALIDKKKLATARDAVGRGVGHKAVIYNNKIILEWLAKKYPEILNLKDNEGRTCAHYSAASRDPEEMYDLLVSLGSNPEIIDIHGRKPIYYISHPEELDIEGPTRSLSRGKRRRISPISPPKRKLIVSPPSITRAQIRIWIHEKDIPKLEKIVWSGHGDKLLLETTNNGKVRRFLENVPHLLSRIKSIHAAAINNDLEGMKDMRTKTELNEIFKAKDLHGLTPLHKAAGLGNRSILEYLMYEVPDGINELDNEGRGVLHYGARDPNIYTFLVKNGANENVLDQKGKSPVFYRTHPLELDTRHLRNVPDAPRVNGDLSGWDRASPTINLGKRRTSSGEFSNNSQVTGKYELNNVELSEGDLRVEEIVFAPEVLRPISRIESPQALREDIPMDSSESKSRSSSRATESRGDERIEGRNTESLSDEKLEAQSVESGGEVKAEELSAELQADSRAEEQNVESQAGVTAEDQSVESPTVLTAEEQRIESRGPSRVSSKTELTKPMSRTSSRGGESRAVSRSNSRNDVEDTGRSFSRSETFVEDVPEEQVAMEEDEFFETPIVDGPQELFDEEAMEGETLENQAPPVEVENQEEFEEAVAITTERRMSVRPGTAVLAVDSNDTIEVNTDETSEAPPPYEFDLANEVAQETNGVEEVLEEPRGQSVLSTHEIVEVEPEIEAIIAEVEEAVVLETEKEVEPEQNDNEEEIDEVEAALRRGDMESLVDKILDGKGEELMNRTTDNKEVQEFLSNVPAYMAKIASIHAAASKGNLRDLQSLLDRKRLALARDKVGRGPLHKAVLNNHTTLARYLASTYPQSLRLLDLKGRSALHFAATLPDSGSMYKFLVNLGADPNVKDIDGNTPGIYLRNRELLTHKELVDEDEALPLDDTPIQRWERPKTPPDVGEGRSRFPAIWSEEGKYLASVLGDALVKGLTEVSQERPQDPVEYLANFLRKYHGEKEDVSFISDQIIENTLTPESLITPADAELLEKFEESEMEKNDIEAEDELVSPLNPPVEILLPDSPGIDSDDSEELIRRLDDEADAIEGVDKEEEEEEERNLREQQQMRDENGQSVLHFASSRPGGGQTIFSFLQNPAVNLAWRDEKLKTARDVATDLGRGENTMSIDSYIVNLAVQGQLEALQKLMLDGYDHLTDITDTSKVNIVQVPSLQEPIVAFLQTVDDFREKIARLHRAIRFGNFEQVKDYVRSDSRLAAALSQYGRSSLHIAVLMEEHSIAQLLANEFPEVLKRGDHLERMPLHYAMGVEKVEKMTRILVRAGAKRVVKDLRGRQPSYYFINREEIAILQEQEEKLKESSETFS